MTLTCTFYNSLSPTNTLVTEQRLHMLVDLLIVESEEARIKSIGMETEGIILHIRNTQKIYCLLYLAS